MLASDLDFFLPPELIAQTPVLPRDSARLLHVRCSPATSAHHIVRDLAHLLRSDDLLVFNDTRVLHARLHGHKVGSGGRVEALLLRELQPNLWQALLKPSARLRTGMEIEFASPRQPEPVRARLEQRKSDSWWIRFLGEENVRALLPALGELPLPPYIHADLADENHYQTIFARHDTPATPAGALDSAAAPTAGLHFTPELMERLRRQGVATAFVTLGVGVGTFRPIKTETLEAHVMHEEEFIVPDATARAIAEQHKLGGRVVAVGTTTTRVLESAALGNGEVRAGYGKTSLFIRPGYRFQCVDALITNFHLPRSTLLAMVAAFIEHGNGDARSGMPRLLECYVEAVSRGYRFFSFGDAMLIE